jgi:N6-adenosine-specific RNA methylase IME4
VLELRDGGDDMVTAVFGPGRHEDDGEENGRRGRNGGTLTELAAVADLGIERLARIEERISGAEDAGLRARWEFGHELLAARDGKGRLPNGYLRTVTERTGVGRAEAGARMKFAERWPTEAELSDAVRTFGSWHQVVHVALKQPDGLEADGGASPLAVPDGQFATIVADPPWRYGNTSTRGAAEDHYPTMTIDELCELDIARDRAAGQAHLYLWATAGHLREAFTVMDAWEFAYKTYLVWVKPQMGMGNYFRVSTELVLFGVKGGMRTRDMATMNYFEQKRGRHSAKPSKFYDLVEKCSPGPYLEMFVRCYRDRQVSCTCSRCLRGWEPWGNQA